jgi:hypothetical protein
MEETKDISIGEDRWIKWVELDSNGDDLYNVDPLLEPLDQLWNELETLCVAGCCGIDAFALWPDDIQNASRNLDSEKIKFQLSKLKVELSKVDKKIICSKRLNNLFDRQVFLEVIEHISSCL